MKEKTGRKYVIACDTKNEALVYVINAYFKSHDEKYSDVEVIDLSKLENSELDGLHIDNYIFENEGKINEESNRVLERLKKVKNANKESDLVATSIDYSDSYSQGLVKLYNEIEETGILVNPGYINISKEDLFKSKNESSKKDFTFENIENSLFYLIKQLTNAYEVSKKIDALQKPDMILKTNGDGITANERFANFLQKAMNEVYKTTAYKDEYTAGHVRRVSDLSQIIADRMCLSEHEREAIKIISILHDTGKIITQSEVLKYQGGLSDSMYLDSLSKHAKDSGKMFCSLFASHYGKNLSTKKESYVKEVLENGNKTTKEFEEEVVDFDALFSQFKEGEISDDVKEIMQQIYNGISDHHKDVHQVYGTKEKLKNSNLIEIVELADSFDAATSDRGYNLPKTLGEFMCDMANCTRENEDNKYHVNKDAAAAFFSYLTTNDDVLLSDDRNSISEEKMKEELEKCKKIIDEIADFDYNAIREFENIDGQKVKLSSERLHAKVVAATKKHKEIDELIGDRKKIFEDDMKLNEGFYTTVDDKIKKYSGRFDLKEESKEFKDEKNKEIYSSYMDIIDPNHEMKDINAISEVNQKYKDATSLVPVARKNLFSKFVNFFTKMASKKQIESTTLNQQINIQDEKTELLKQLSELTNSDEELANKIISTTEIDKQSQMKNEIKNENASRD